MKKIEQHKVFNENINDKLIIDKLWNKYYALWETLKNKKLPQKVDIKIGKRSFIIKAWHTKFRIDYLWENFWYIVRNLSDGKWYTIKKWEEKTLWKLWDIQLDADDTKASRKHLKLRVDNENNLFLCDNSKHWTFIDEVINSEGKKETMKCEKITSEEIKELKNATKSKEAQCFYEKDERYKPKHKILLKDWKTFYVTDKMYTNHEYEEIIGYIMYKGKLELRMFYKSGSEQVWRSCPWVREGGGLSKWEGIKNYSYETTTKVDISLWLLFDTLALIEARDIEPILRESRNIKYNLLQDKMIQETKIDTLFNDSTSWDVIIYEIERKIKSWKLNKKEMEEYTDLKKRVNEKIKSGAIFHGWMSMLCRYKSKFNEKDMRYRDLDSLSRMYEKLVPKWFDYQHMTPIREEKYEYNHQYLWKVQTAVYKCNWNWRPLKIYFSRAQDNESLVRIDNIIDYEWKINSFWIHERWINASPLISKPVEYIKQTPYMDVATNVWNRFDRDKDWEIDGDDYVDIRSIYQSNPIIKHYKKLEGLL